MIIISKTYDDIEDNNFSVVHYLWAAWSNYEHMFLSGDELVLQTWEMKARLRHQPYIKMKARLRHQPHIKD